tara:strand:- start:340 stop:588 length:249 start_codon:yes stop_codon:yes gene_type:complete
MNTKFKRGEKVKLIRDPSPEYVEYHTENTEHEQTPITKGMTGKVNVILQNGQYHIEVFDENGKEFAYVPVDEDSIESLENQE